MTHRSSAVDRSLPRISVVLGSGAARGLGHIPYLEVFDELGVLPSIIAGSSIGALIGAGWASGMRGKDVREHAYSVLGTLGLIAGRLWTSRRSLRETLQAGLSLQADAPSITSAFLPELFPDNFSSLPIPFRAVATDLNSWEPVVFSSGPLKPAIAASLAIPALFVPVTLGTRTFIDGGVSNPLPLDCVVGYGDIVVAIDVNGLPEGKEPRRRPPNAIEVGFTATRIMTRTLIQNMVKRHPPDIYVEAPVGRIGVMEFWRVREIVAASEAGKDHFKRTLADRIEAFQRTSE